MSNALPLKRVLLEPVFVCSICGKPEKQKGFCSDVPSYWACEQCRAKMKKIVLNKIVYEDGWRDISGHCDICGSFPCKHVTPNWELQNLPKWDPKKEIQK